jgi:class 3 adenylate cyclase
MMTLGTEFFHRLRDRLYALGAEGLEGAELRQVNMAAVTSVIVLVTMPSFALFFALYDFDRLNLAIQIVLLVMVPQLLPLILLSTGRVLAARVVLALLINGTIAFYGYLYGVSSGTALYNFGTVLLAFLVFGHSRWPLLVTFVLLPMVLSVYETFYFLTPHPALNMDQDLLDTLFVLNAVTTFIIISLITHTFYALVVRAEDGLQKAHDREVRFAGAVSEYLDPSLVEGLRGGADLEPRVRHLTVFFSDLVGSTRISFAMDRDAYGRMINAYVHAMQAIIKGAGAYIEDISGDGVLGYFGNFETQGAEADAARAVAMAQGMQFRLAELVPTFKRDFGLPENLAMRIGMASGEAMVGKTAGARAIYTANGDVVNLGAKLEKAVKEVSPGGGILLSEAMGRAIVGGITPEIARHRHEMVIEGEPVITFLVGGSPDAV